MSHQPFYTQGVAGMGDYSGVSAGPLVNQPLDYPDAEGSPYLPQYGSIGSDMTLPPSSSMTTSKPDEGWLSSPTVKMAASAASMAGMVLGAYHGYKRNNSVGWAIGWALLGGVFPFITVPLSVAQGFGKKKAG